MCNVLITGASGFIGSALWLKLSTDNKIIGVDITMGSDKPAKINWEQADMTDWDSTNAVCEKHSPDVVIHCAGIAHQKMGYIDSATYMRVNSAATENLAKVAAKFNPDVSFIFLSSVSVYSEGPHPRGIRSVVTSEFHGAGINPQISQTRPPRLSPPGYRLRRSRWRPGESDGGQVSQNGKDAKKNNRVGEDEDCHPSSDYAYSKLDAEKRLISLYDEGLLRNLIILRLAPVYDSEWSLNLDRRVFAPKKMAYLKFGNGKQKMSALARPNLVDFIEYLIHTPEEYASLSQVNSTGRGLRRFSLITDKSMKQKNLRIFNVCDAEPYDFNTIIKIFKRSGVHPNRPVIVLPLPFVWIATRVAGLPLPRKKKWLHSGYDKLASDLVFDNTRMLETGFTPRHTLETIFDPQITRINTDFSE